MGTFDSSKTRVQPIFDALYRRHPSGEGWLDRLLTMGGRAPVNPVGALRQQPRFEFIASPSKDFLRWMVMNTETWPLNWTEAKMPKHVLEARKFLAKGEPKRSEALAAIEVAGNDPRAYSGWWCLEGPTHVDCALFTERAVIFIEGKRTELAASKGIRFAATSDQIARNLDCAKRYGKEKSLDFYAMLVIEDGDKQRAFIASEVGAQIRKSLPHLSPEEAAQVEGHYLDFTTWQAIVEAFRLPPTLLAT
jgi:hypothetical protein